MRVWVVRTGALGDFVATLPVLDALRARADELVVVAPRRYAALFRGADQWIDSDGTGALAMHAGRLPLDDVDVAVAWTSGVADALRRCGVCRVLEGAPRPPAGVAIHDHLWAPLLEGFGPRTAEPVVRPEPKAVDAIAARLGGLRPVVIAPGSGGKSKRWPLQRWQDVATHVGRPVLWVGGPVEAGEAGWGEPAWHDLDLSGLTALAILCHTWLGPDSGPSHLAAAAGARVGVLFTGVTDPRNWAPPGARIFDGGTSAAALAAWVRL